MIISLKHNYIYIRTRKTGSSTIESILRNNLGPDDIVVRQTLDTLRPVMKPGAVIPDDDGLVTHASAARVRPLIRDDVWERLFKFTSERHPYEKALSFAHHRLRVRNGHVRHGRSGPDDDFDDFLDRVVRSGKYSSFNYYAIDGKSVVDDYIRLETLNDDLQRIGARTGVPMPEAPPHRRESEREDDRAAHEILSGEQKDIVYEHCRPEFDLLGYAR